MMILQQSVKTYGFHTSDEDEFYLKLPNSSSCSEDGERILIYEGEIPNYILEAERISAAWGKSLFQILQNQNTSLDDLISIELTRSNLTRSNPSHNLNFDSYITIVLERGIEIEDSLLREDKYIWLTVTDKILNLEEELQEYSECYKLKSTSSNPVDPLINKILFCAPGRHSFSLPCLRANSCEWVASVRREGVSLEHRLTSERYRHITEKVDRVKITPKVLEVVKNPMRIYEGRSGELIAANEWESDTWIAVFYKEKDNMDSFIITAFLIKEKRLSKWKRTY